MSSFWTNLFGVAGKGARQASTRAPLTLEVLEDRTLPSVVFAVVGHGGPPLARPGRHLLHHHRHHAAKLAVSPFSVVGQAVSPVGARHVTVAPALSAAVSSAPVGAQVVQFAHGWLGRQVGGGECTDLAEAALHSVGAKTTEDFGVWGDNADYVWGTLLVTYKAGNAPSSLNQVHPGDVIQFRDVQIQLTSGGSWWTSNYPQHTAIVEKNAGSGRLTLLEQNINGEGWVHEDPVVFSAMTAGTIWVYRPVAR